ncbi:hypothetical protein LGL55_11130 [Clostridium tagluense]|nr:hypothetical protein [Clostridium tagluense]MCB2321387.1 hypothetical protein [Clostridium tagluense]MCB2335926.1 hypothetical protein [Clostridium tagluense]MCB2364777.1 hypothetical protein [Clostridium tagluense]
MVYDDCEKFAEWFSDINTAIGIRDAAGNYSIESTKEFQSFKYDSA